MRFNWLKSKTFWGVVLSVGATLLKNPHIGPTEVIQALGPVLDATQVSGAGLAVIGLRDAVGKVGGV